MKRLAIYSCLTLGILFTFAACSAQVNGVPEPRTAPDNRVASGQRLLAGYGCGSCHTIPGVPGANGKAASALDRYYERTYIAGRLPNTSDNLVAWIQNPQQIDPGNAMPTLGVSAEEAGDMAAYLYQDHTFDALLNR